MQDHERGSSKEPRSSDVEFRLPYKKMPTKLSSLNHIRQPQLARVTIGDQSHDGKILVEGEDAGAIINTVFGDAPADFGAVILTDEFVGIGRITPQKYLLITPPNTETDIIAQLENASGDHFITVTNQTDGQGGIYIAGNHATNLLSQLCGLDFSDTAFPINTVKISSVAKIRATIWRLEDGWHIWIGRSHAQYITDIIRAAEATR